MKKVIYACFLLVASMSIVSCEKEKKESKDEYLIDKIDVYIDGYLIRDSTFYYTGDNTLDYVKYRKYDYDGEMKYEYNVYYDEYGNILESADPSFPSVVASYTYKDSKIDTMVLYSEGEYFATKKFNYYDNGCSKEEVVIDFKPIEGADVISSSYYSLPYYDEYNNYVVDVLEVYENDAFESFTHVKVLDYNSENEYDENGLVIKKSYYYPAVSGQLVHYELYISYKKK